MSHKHTVISLMGFCALLLCSMGVVTTATGTAVYANEFVLSETVNESSGNNKTKKESAATKKKPRSKMIREGTRLGMMFVPKLKVRSPIVEGVTGSMFDIGMGHWPGTAMPGERGNAVYGGHRTSGPAPLYNVNKLKKGDSIIILRGLKRTHYKVTATFVVKPTAVWITRQSSKSMLTLFSCHPRHSTKRRYIVQATLVK